MPTPITQENIHFSDSKTTVIDGKGGKALRNALIQKQVLTFAELVQGDTIVRPEEISIDDQGRVVIISEDFQKALQLRIDERAKVKSTDVAFFDTNCSCRG
jgi:hypothetical protein